MGAYFAATPTASKLCLSHTCRIASNCSDTTSKFQHAAMQINKFKI